MRWLKGIGVLVGIPLAVFVAFYVLFGLRMELTGGGMPRLAFTTDHDTQAEIIRQHRATQRAEPAPSGVEAAAPVSQPAAPLSSSTPAAETSAASAAAPLPSTGSSADWTDFRGPKRDGHYVERALLPTWPSTGLVPLWRQPSGAGYASFVAAGGRAFTIEQRGREETMVAYDVMTGRELWTNSWPALFAESMGGDGPRATPTWSGGFVYALGAEGELRCLDDATGRLIWRVNILEDAGAANLPWGMAGAPLVRGDTVIVTPGGSNGQSVVAYDRRTGKRVWASSNERAGYASPMVATLAGREHLLVFTGVGLLALSPDSGERLWFHPWRTNADINAAQPLVVSDNRVLISSGYDVGAAVLEVVREGDRYLVHEIWRNNRMKNRFASSVLHNGFIYGLDESILGCIDAATGELKWKGGRYGYGQLLLSGDRLIVLTERGELVLVAANPDRHEELARFPALEGKTWNPPAVTRGILLVRNLREMAAFDLGVR